MKKASELCFSSLHTADKLPCEVGANAGLSVLTV